jgi:DNA-binding HxlR family transcriptional regulator
MKNLSFIDSKSEYLSNAMQIICNKWTALILAELEDGPKRYCQIEREVNSINPRILSKRLDQLEENKIIKKIKNPDSSTFCLYTLTTKGLDLIPVIKKMSEWGNKYFY